MYLSRENVKRMVKAVNNCTICSDCPLNMIEWHCGYVATVVTKYNDLPENVWEWADKANTLIAYDDNNGKWDIIGPYDDFEPMTTDELIAFCDSELKEIRKAKSRI